jgi:hypothetical protein
VSFLGDAGSSVGNRVNWEAEVFMAGDLTVGDKIYRPVCCPDPQEMRDLVLANPAMEHFEDDTVMLRAKSDGGTPPLWQVVPWDEGGGRVCVCDEPSPETGPILRSSLQTSTLWRSRRWWETWRN